MLQLLHIENIAVIERADIELDKGLTVLSGETGAGKSIVIDSIGALLGKRVSRDLVRSGAQKGFVSAVFTDLPRALRELLDELALSGDEPDTLYVQRQISADGKSTCRVNMKPASAAVLRQLAPYLIDIHGQNDGQKLLDEAIPPEISGAGDTPAGDDRAGDRRAGTPAAYRHADLPQGGNRAGST